MTDLERAQMKMSSEDCETITKKILSKRKSTSVDLTIFDAMKTASEYCYGGDTLFVRDFRRGLYENCLRYVNAGADDFNSETQKASLDSVSLCPSIMVAHQYEDILSRIRQIKQKYPKIDSMMDDKTISQKGVCAEYGDCCERLNDFLYIYRKLKTSPKGLNMKCIENWCKAYPEQAVQVEKGLKEMEKMLPISEQERWKRTTEKKIAPSFFQKILGKGLKR